jgi:hypothetical protein
VRTYFITRGMPENAVEAETYIGQGILSLLCPDIINVDLVGVRRDGDHYIHVLMLRDMKSTM